ncbi:MAG: response regulator [Bacteroidales bacterium]
MEGKTSPLVLVVDDSNTNVVLLEAILNDKGYEIETALNAKEAFAIMETKVPDLILLDLLMPKINGYDFLQQVKGNDRTKDIPVIIVSAVTESENIRKTIDMGAVDFIKKPIDIQDLIEKVSKTLKI